MYEPYTKIPEELNNDILYGLRNHLLSNCVPKIVAPSFSSILDSYRLGNIEDLVRLDNGRKEIEYYDDDGVLQKFGETSRNIGKDVGIPQDSEDINMSDNSYDLEEFYSTLKEEQEGKKKFWKW